MIIEKEKSHIIIQEKDFKKNVNGYKGHDVDIIYVPSELLEKWETSDVKASVLLCLKKQGKIIII